MKKAFWCAIAILVVSMIQSAFTGTGGLQGIVVSILSILSTVMSLVVFNYSIEGIGKLGQQIGHSGLMVFGHRIMMWLTIGIVVAIIANLASNVIGQIAACACLVIMLAVYIGYLIFLSRAKRFLAQS